MQSGIQRITENFRDQTGISQKLEQLEHFDADTLLLDDNGLFGDLDDDLDFSGCDALSTATDEGFPRFSDIQKSVETLRRALPYLFDDETVDFLFQAIVTSCSEDGSRSDPGLVLKGGLHQAINPLISKLKQNGKKTTRRQIQNTNTCLDDDLWPNARVSLPPTPPSFFKYNDPYFQPNKRQQRPSRKDRFDMIANITECTKVPTHNNSKPPTPNIPKNKMQKQALRLKHSQLEKVWTRQHELILLDRYKAGQKFSIIKDAFQLEFPQQSKIYSIETIRCKFYKIIRTAIRELQQHMQNIGLKKLPQLVPLSDEMIKTVMYHCSALPARLFLIEIYTHEECEYGLIRKAIEALNELFQFKSR